MALVSMKSDESGMEYKPNPYGYGLTLHLNDDQCEALGIKEPLRAGSQVSIKAIAYVANVTESVEEDGDDMGNDVSMCLQITDMELAQATKQVSGSDLYPSGEQD